MAVSSPARGVPNGPAHRRRSCAGLPASSRRCRAGRPPSWPDRSRGGDEHVSTGGDCGVQNARTGSVGTAGHRLVVAVRSLRAVRLAAHADPAADRGRTPPDRAGAPTPTVREHQLHGPILHPPASRSPPRAPRWSGAALCEHHRGPHAVRQRGAQPASMPRLAAVTTTTRCSDMPARPCCSNAEASPPPTMARGRAARRRHRSPVRPHGSSTSTSYSPSFSSVVASPSPST